MRGRLIDWGGGKLGHEQGLGVAEGSAGQLEEKMGGS